MEVKLGTHVYFSVFMTTMNKNGLRHFFPITTSSLLKLANHVMHGSETWYAYVFQCFHDNHEQKMASGTYSHNYFFTSQTCKPCMQCMEVKLYLSVSMTAMNKKLPWALFLLHFSNLQTIVVKLVCKCISQHFHDEL